MRESLGLIEVTGWSPTIAVLDAMEKAADVTLRQIELNDLYGACIKITGSAAAVKAAVHAADEIAGRMKATCVSSILNAPDPGAWKAIEAPREFNPLLEADVVYFPNQSRQSSQEKHVPDSNKPSAIGLIETQGLTAVLEAVDCACKAGNVEVVGREKLGGGYVTVILRGDVAAVKAAVEAGKQAVDGLGKLIAAHVIARPSEGVLSLLPKG